MGNLPNTADTGAQRSRRRAHLIPILAAATFVVVAGGGGSVPVSAQDLPAQNIATQDVAVQGVAAQGVAAQGSVNLASSGPATQSSTSYQGDPTRAIDGNTSGAWKDGSVTSTAATDTPWWDLEIGPSTVDRVVLWNRTDCCVDRLSNAWVFISPTPFGNSTLKELKADPSIVKRSISGAPRPQLSLDFAGARGRYVRVQLEGSNRILSLAEVQVFGTRTGTGVRLTNPSQSSTSYGGKPERAVDGNISGQWRQNSVTATGLQTDPSWQAEFDRAGVYRVDLWNRTDCCADRLADAWIFVSDAPMDGKTLTQLKDDPTVHSRRISGVPSPTASANFGGVQARYVRVQLEGASRILSLAEVKLIAEPMLSQSSTGTWGGIVGEASKAVDGNLNGAWSSGSVSHTAAGDRSPWWNIQLTSPAGLRRIEILNRTDCCGERLNNMTVRVSTNAPNACEGPVEAETTIKDFNNLYGKRVDLDKSADDRYPVVRSVCIKKDSEYLAMAEVAFRYNNGNDQLVDENGHFVKPLSDYYFGYAGWNGAVFTAKNDDNDIIDTWANDLGESEFATAFQNKWFDGNMLAGTTKVTYCQFERHVYPYGGDDVMNMIFSEYKGSERRRCGHHVSGYTGSDTFNFVGVDNVNAGKIVVGRINDYDVTRDRLQIDGVDIDPYRPPANVRFVAWNGDYPDRAARPQIWIVITSKSGGEIFYTLEGQRYQFRNGDAGNAEKHFIKNVPDDLRTLGSIPFEDVHMFVPYGEYRDLKPGSFQEYYRYSERAGGVTWEAGQVALTGSDDRNKVDVIHGSTLQDYAYAGAGNDLVTGGSAYDLLFGEDGNDKIWAGTEDDEAFGGPGRDYIEGNWGDDIVAGDGGDDQLFGNDGDDVLFGDQLAGPTLATNYWHIDNAFAVKPQAGGSGISSGTVLRFQRKDDHQLVVSDDDDRLGTSDPTGQQTKTAVEGAGGIATGIPVGGTATYAGSYKVRSASGVTGEMAWIRVTSNLADPKVKTPAPIDLLVFMPGFNPGPDETITFTSGVIAAPQGISYREIAELLASPGSSSGNDVLEGGAGDDELWGGPGRDTFVVGTDSGADLVADFEVGTDVVRVIGASQAGLTISRSGNDAIAKIGSSSIRFLNRAGQISATNFDFRQ